MRRTLKFSLYRKNTCRGNRYIFLFEIDIPPLSKIYIFLHESARYSRTIAVDKIACVHIYFVFLLASYSIYILYKVSIGTVYLKT